MGEMERRHDRLVAIADKLLYYVMPSVDGQSLAVRLERDGPLPIRDVMRLLRDIADGLSSALAMEQE